MGYFLRKHELRADLSTLPPSHRIAFAAVVAERHLPVYERFCEEYRWGNPNPFRFALELVWRHLKGKRLSKGEVERLTAELYPLVPDSDEFPIDSRPIYACDLVREALCACVGDTRASARRAARDAYTIVADYDAIEEALDVTAWNSQLARGPRLIQEEEEHRRLLHHLRSVPTLDDSAIREIRERFGGGGSC